MAKKPKKPAKRKPGGQRPSERPLPPEALLEVSELWLKGWPITRIAERFGVHHSTIQHHLNNTIRPQWLEQMSANKSIELAKISLVERTAWERFEAAEPGEVREVIEKGLLEGGSRPRIVKEAVAKVTRTGAAAWLQIVQWCVEQRLRIHGLYAPSRHYLQTESELRVAGRSPSEVDAMMVERLMAQVVERQKQSEALKRGRGLN